MPRARYKQLVDALAGDIRSGLLVPGTRLPTHRQLAQEHGVALATATRIYAELEAMGLVSGETGRGTFVRETALPPGQGIDQTAAGADMLDLNFNYPALPEQANLLRKALRDLAMAGDMEALLRYQPHGGRQHEQQAVAAHLRERGVSVAAEQVLLVSGAQHGLAITAMALLRPGDVVAVDALTYSGFKVLAEAYRLELAPIAASAKGPDLDALRHLCKTRRVRALYCMPTLHNPLGWVLDLATRQAMVDIAREHGVLIIEDAAYAFLADDPPHAPPPPIATLAPELTIYVSGFSKSIATGLRVGFVAAPQEHLAALQRCIRATTWNTPSVMTAIACRWLEDGTVARLEAQKRRDASARQAILRESLNGYALVGHPASYFTWLPLGEDVRADVVAMALLNEGVSVSTAEPFSTAASVPHALRLALGSLPLTVLPQALAKVRAALQRAGF